MMDFLHYKMILNTINGYIIDNKLPYQISRTRIKSNVKRL